MSSWALGILFLRELLEPILLLVSLNPDFQLLRFKLDDFISVCALLAPAADIQSSQSQLAKNHTLINGRSMNTSTVRLCSER